MTDVAQALATRPPGLAPGVNVFIPSHRSSNESEVFLPRFDPRDVFILKKPVRERGEIRLAVNDHPDGPTLERTMRELLPVPHVTVRPVAAEIDPLVRVRSLFTNPTVDGGIAPKWIVDTLLNDDTLDRDLRGQLLDSMRIVLPLSVRLPLPGQGAIAIRHEDTVSLACLGCDTTGRNVAAEFEAYDRGERVTIVTRSFGDVVWRRSTDSVPISVSFKRRTGSLPKAVSRDSVWPPNSGEDRNFVRSPLAPPQLDLSPSVGLIISKAEALPESVKVPDSTVVVVPGTTTWRKLTQRNIWVHGSFDGLGEEELLPLTSSFPQVVRWIKLGHTGAIESGVAELLPTYRLEATRPAPSVSRYTHFFWKSGSEFEHFLETNPGMRSAWHGSGPGHTHATIVRHLKDETRAAVFTGIDDFLEHVL